MKNWKKIIDGMNVQKIQPIFSVMFSVFSKCSDLFRVLAAHPQIQGPRGKEPHWWTRLRFHSEERDCNPTQSYTWELIYRTTGCRYFFAFLVRWGHLEIDISM